MSSESTIFRYFNTGYKGVPSKQLKLINYLNYVGNLVPTF